MGSRSVNIKEIKVGERLRKKVGSIQNMENLERSIATTGLIHPIVVNAKFELLIGARRLEACKALGWNEIQANVINGEGQ